jgi:hypothetical protein
MMLPRLLGATTPYCPQIAHWLLLHAPTQPAPCRLWAIASPNPHSPPSPSPPAQLGLDPSLVEVLCSVPPFLSKHFLSVTPVIGSVPASWVPQPNPAEVGAVFSMPLAAFLDSAGHRCVCLCEGGRRLVGAPFCLEHTPLASCRARAGHEPGTRRRPSRLQRGRWVQDGWPAWRGCRCGVSPGGASLEPRGCPPACHARAPTSLTAPAGGPVPCACRHRDAEWQGYRYRLHFFGHQGFDVWGLTAAILITVRPACLPGSS